MKGFLRVMETIVATLLLLSASSLVFRHRPESSWPSVSVMSLSWDILQSLKASGMLRDWAFQNSEEASSSMWGNASSLMQGAAGFMVSTRNIPRPEAYVAVNSSWDEFSLSAFNVSSDRISMAGIGYSMYAWNMPLENLSGDKIYSYDCVVLGASQADYLSGGLKEYASQGGCVIIEGDAESSFAEEMLNLSYGPEATGSAMFDFSHFKSADIGMKFLHSWFYEPVAFDTGTGKLKGSITLHGTAHEFYLEYDENCVNYSGACYHEGEEFQVSDSYGTWKINVTSIKGTDGVYFKIDSPDYLFPFKTTYYGTGQLSSGGRILLSCREYGKGGICLVADRGDDGFRALLRSAALWATSRFSYFVPSYFYGKHDIRGLLVEKPWDRRRYYMAVAYVPTEAGPTEFDLYAWPSY